MAALTAGMNRPGATADLGPGGPPAARTTGPAGEAGPPRSPPAPGPSGPGRGPGRPGRGRGVDRVGRHRAEDRVRAGLPAAGHPAVPAPGHVHHPACRRGGVRRVRAARLAGRRALDQRPDPPVRQVVRDLLLRARHGRAGGLPPAGPGRAARAPWPVTTIVSCLPVLVLAMGPRWPTCSAPMLAPQRTHRTMGPEDQQYRGPLPGPPRTRQRCPRTRPHPRRLWPGPVLPQGPGRPRSRTTTPGRQRQSRPASARHAWPPAGLQQREGRYPDVPCASEGIRGSNQVLNALACTIKAELAGTAVVPARPGNAVV